MATEEVGVKIVRIVYDATKAREGAQQAKRSLEEIERQAVVTGGAVGRMEGTLGALGAGFGKAARFAGIFGVALTAAGAVSFARDLTQAVGGLATMAEQLTTNTRYLQSMQYAATGVSTKLEDLEKGSAAFALKIGQASEGNKDAIETFQRLGVKILDAKGNVRPFNDLLTESATRLNAVDNANVKSALSTELFDKAGRKMLTLLPELAKGQENLADKTERAGAMITPDTIEKWDKLGSTAEQSMLKWRAFAAENFFEPVALGFKVVAAAIELSLIPLKVLIRGIELVGASGRLLAQKFTTGPDTGTGAVETQERIEFERNNIAGQPGSGPLLKKLALDRDRVERTGGQGFGGTESIDLATRFKSPSTGAGDPIVRGAGAGDAERIAKLGNTLRAAAEAQDIMTAAALRGGVAFQEQEIRSKSLEQAMQAYGDKLDRNHPKVKALAAEIEQFNRRVVEGKAAETFALQTTELGKQNEILEAELRLMNEFPEVRARELALIKAKQEAEKGGKAVTAEMLDQRRAAIEQNEVLKAQGAEIKRANDLWTEPLKTALSSIQSSTADWIDGMLQGLETGKFAVADFGKIGISIARRMVSEFAALAVIRPMMGSMIGGLQSIGLVSGSTASSLGFGGSGGGGMSMPSFGGGGMFGFLGNPMTGSIDQTTGLATGALGGLTWGQGLAGAASIGMGAYNMATSKGIGGMLGGGLSILGGGIGLASMAGLLPMLGAAGGPIGMGLGLAGMLLPMLLGGGEEYKWAPLAGGNVQFNPGAGGYAMNATQQNGGKSIAGQFGGVGSTLDAFFKAAGGLTDPGLAFGASIWNNQREGTTSTYLISPTQGSNQQTYDESGDPAAAVDRLIAKVFYDSIQNNAAMKASPTLRTAFANREPTGTAEISGLFDLIAAYDQLGKNENITKAETALKGIDAQFASLTAGANEWGLSLAPITAEIAKQRKAYADDFLHTIDAVLDPAGTALDDFAKERAAGMKEWKYINDNVRETVIAQAKVEEYYAKRAADLDKQINAERIAMTTAAVASMEEAIRRLSPGGAGANLNPSGTLAGIEATYSATYGQAAGGDAAAISRLAGEGTAYADYSKSYFAGSPEYNAIRDRLLADFRTIQAAVQVPTAADGTPLDVNTSANNNAQFQQLMATVQTLTKKLDQRDADNARLMGLLSRYLTNGRSAA